jgi:hypothetical protein
MTSSVRGISGKTSRLIGHWNFYFKDGELRMCIDYYALNKIKIK